MPKYTCMKFLIKSALVLFVAAASFTACKKEKENVVPEASTQEPEKLKKAGQIIVNINNVVAGQPLIMDTVWYLTESKDSFRVTEYKYYISNFVFYTEGGSSYAEPNSYHLVDMTNPSSMTFTVPNVPPGRYDSVSFIMGLDSNKIATTDMTGIFSEATDMYWGTEWGYRMARMTGFAPLSPWGGQIEYNVGGYTGVNNVIKNVSVKFNTVREVNGNDQRLKLDADAQRWFYGEYNIRLATDYNSLKPGSVSNRIAANYARMFSDGGY